MQKYEIIKKVSVSDTICLFEIYAPLIASFAKAGQFVILRYGEGGERVPVTLVDWDKSKGSITVIIQAIGKSTLLFNTLKEGQSFSSVTGPLGTAIEVKKYGTVAVVGGGVGIAEILPIAKVMKEAGNKIVSILGARTKDLLILEREMEELSDTFVIATDDGSKGQKGMVTDALKTLSSNGVKIDAGFIIGPIPMMKFTAKLMVGLGIKPFASLNPIMLDGTGMCGCCRVEVNGETKFACVDGPMFEAQNINFDNLMKRTSEYTEQQKISLQEFEKTHKCKIGLH